MLEQTFFTFCLIIAKHGMILTVIIIIRSFREEDGEMNQNILVSILTLLFYITSIVGGGGTTTPSSTTPQETLHHPWWASKQK